MVKRIYILISIIVICVLIGCNAKEKTPISVELSSGEETLLYSEEPFRDVRVTLTNKEGNPGAIKAKIIAVDTDGQRGTLGAGMSSNPLINLNQSWTSIKIASSYAKFEVWVEASEHDGKYSILCDVE